MEFRKKTGTIRGVTDTYIKIDIEGTADPAGLAGTVQNVKLTGVGEERNTGVITGAS